FTSDFFPVGSDFREIVAAWIGYLRETKAWGSGDPLFPATEVTVGQDAQFVASGIKREHWKGTGPIRTIFADAFRSAGLSYCNPHSIRRTLARLGQSMCRTPEEYKAWSQNLGHEEVLTTFRSYGNVERRRQCEIMRELARPKTSESTLAKDLAAFLESRAQRS